MQIFQNRQWNNKKPVFIHKMSNICQEYFQFFFNLLVLLPHVAQVSSQPLPREPLAPAARRLPFIRPRPQQGDAPSQFSRAGHNFRCPLISMLSVDPLINGTALIFHFENVILTEERLFLNLDQASALKILFCRIF
jgi:hypothetical protein